MFSANQKICTLLTTMATSVLFAGMDMDSRVSQLETQMKEVRTKNENDTYGALTGTGVPTLKDPTHFVLGIGAVYQTATLTQTDFGYTSETEIGALPLYGRLLEGKSSNSWGINVMAGYNLPLDHTYIALTNNYFDISATQKADAGSNGVIDPTRQSYVIEDYVASSALYATKATSDWSITYDLLGAELGKEFYVSRALSFKTSIGLLNSWIWLQDRISYTGGNGGNSQLGDNSEYIKDKSNYWGIGPQVGTVVGFGLGKGFTFFADLKGALMYGRLKVDHYDYMSVDPDVNSLEIDGFAKRVLPYLSATLGLSYDRTTQSQKNHFKFRAGYNIQYFVGANQMLYPVAISANYEFKRQEGSLQTAGLMLDASWSF